MSTVLERTSPMVAVDEATPEAVGTPVGGRHASRRRDTAKWLLPLLAVAATAHAWGMSRAPQRVDDEGTYTAQAYAVEHFGELAHYTFWYDHPPLGWLQISLWTWLTDGFDRVTPAVVAGREAMLVAHLVSVVLLWALARRIGLSRGAAAVGCLVFSLSPLAVSFHRMVYLDNVATPWLLAAFFLAAARRHQLGAFSASAMCFVMMVLTKETTLLLLPVYAWWMAQHADRLSRRYTLTVAGSLLVVCGMSYAVFATLKGELLPGGEHVSLLDGIAFQLFERPGSGSVLDRDSQAGDTVEIWLQLDVVLPVLATLAALVMLALPRMRPIAAAYLLLLVLMLRPGYLPVPYVVAMIPFGALLVAAALHEGVRRAGRIRVATLGAAFAAAVVTVPLWAAGLSGLMTQDQDREVREAQDWLVRNADTDERLLVDDAIWVDMVEAGFPRENVIWYYKADTDPEVMEDTPRGWRDYDWLMVTESVRQSVALTSGDPGSGPYPAVAEAYERSEIVASFGEGPQRVDIRRIEDTGARLGKVRR